MPDSSVKADFQVHRLSQASEILFDLFSEMGAIIREGYCGIDVQKFALDFLARRGADPALRGYRGFQADISVSVNHVAAHGIPTEKTFHSGDIVTIDCTIVYRGWYGDMAWTYAVPPVNPRTRRLIAAAWQSCLGGCRVLKPGISLGTLGSHVVNAAKQLGGQVVNEFCGHGIGRELHEDPIIPYTSRPGEGWKVQKGMVLNIEPVVTLGDPGVTLADDGMSYYTVDGQPTAQFELTCTVGDSGTRILSLPGLSVKEISEYPPFF